MLFRSDRYPQPMLEFMFETTRSVTDMILAGVLQWFHLYFDLAGSPVPHQLRALLEVADPQRILYGSDYPFTPRQACDSLLRQLERTPLLEAPLRDMVWRDNAIKLLSTTDAGRVGIA